MWRGAAAPREIQCVVRRTTAYENTCLDCVCGKAANTIQTSILSLALEDSLACYGLSRYDSKVECSKSPDSIGLVALCGYSIAEPESDVCGIPARH
jgi:hypothetical protein